MSNGQIWLINFSPSVGDEIQKVRPAVIVSDDEMDGLALRIVVPLTDARKQLQPWHVKIKSSTTNNLTKESLADCFQIKSISKERFQRKIGVLSTKDMDDVKACISNVLDLI